MNTSKDIYILNLETATKNCSVSLSKNGTTLAYKEISEQGFSHAENLHQFIEDITKSENILISQLDAIAVSEGPGSYTGLRIGVSAAKGLCYALNIPLISVNTLEILARNIQITTGLIVPMIDARRMEVYSMILDSNYNIIRATEAQIIDENSFADLNENIFFVGDGVAKTQEILHKPGRTFDLTNIYPSSKNMSIISYDKYQNKDFKDVAYFEPYYLKDFMITK